jgi:hypothetical protein
MSLVSNLVKNNITFKFDGSAINVDASNCDKLVECKIPFSFNDGCIRFDEVKKNVSDVSDKVIGVDIMTTIYNLLVKSNKFIVGNSFDGKDTYEKHRKNILLQHDKKLCTLQLWRNKFVIKYEKWDATINFASSWADIQSMMPNCIDNLILMIIAGFYTTIRPVNLYQFRYFSKNTSSFYQITYNISGSKLFRFEKDNNEDVFGEDNNADAFVAENLDNAIRRFTNSLGVVY